MCTRDPSRKQPSSCGRLPLLRLPLADSLKAVPVLEDESVTVVFLGEYNNPLKGAASDFGLISMVRS